VVLYTGQTSNDACFADAKAHVLKSYPTAVFGAVNDRPIDQYGVDQIGLGWRGNFTNGTPSAGDFDCFFIPKTGNILAIFSGFFTTAGKAAEPYPDEFQFMRNSVYESFTNAFLKP
jgi:hypothetical protein